MSTFGQINLVVNDMATSVAFYRLLELDMPESYEWPEGSGAEHISDIPTEPSSYMALDNYPMAAIWSGEQNEERIGGVIVGLMVQSRDDVDRLYEAVRAAGYQVGRAPYDAFFGSRYAIVIDPDGNRVGLKSPIETDRKYVPEYEITRDNDTTPTRPIGYWLKLLDGLIEADLGGVLRTRGLTRRQWQALNVVNEHPTTTAEITNVLAPFLDADTAAALVSELAAGEWIEIADDGTVEVTSFGRECLAGAQGAIATARKRIGEGISEHAYRTTTFTLETMATNLGWRSDGDEVTA